MNKSKNLLIFFLVLTLLFSNTSMIFATNEDISLVVDHEKIDTEIISKGGRTLLPMRKVFEILGARVDWNHEKREVTGTKGDIEVKLVIGSKEARVNGERYELDVPAQLINSLTYVPIRFVGESLGNKVEWDHDTKTVLIYSDLEESNLDSEKEFKLSEEEIYRAMLSLKEDYPHMSKWDNNDKYEWNGGLWTAGYGCAGFAFMLSDAAFGDLPATKIDNPDFQNLRVGDIIRINENTHSVIVLKIEGDEVTIAEGNMMGMAWWGRTLSLGELEKVTDYVITRYPN